MSTLPSSVISFDRATGYARVCAWCRNKAEGDQWAFDQHLQVSHGICEACVKQQASDAVEPLMQLIKQLHP